MEEKVKKRPEKVAQAVKEFRDLEEEKGQVWDLVYFSSDDDEDNDSQGSSSVDEDSGEEDASLLDASERDELKKLNNWKQDRKFDGQIFNWIKEGDSETYLSIINETGRTLFQGE